MAIGDAVYRGDMVEWPLPTPPTPQPPECEGEEGCLCEDTSSWPNHTYFEPDGDWRADRWCGDDDGEMTCVETKFGAQTKRICTKCDAVRGPGCECDNQRPCEVGECFGNQTFNGGVGRCFKEPPLSWACLADCDRLFNSPAGWCYSDYPTGKARCMDRLCSKPEAFNCNLEGNLEGSSLDNNLEGQVCRYGECVVECDTTADCQAKGYPGSFVCQSNRCEYGFATE
ncbi:MAG: hypothetical protein ACREA0_01170 [bacterium]